MKKRTELVLWYKVKWIAVCRSHVSLGCHARYRYAFTNIIIVTARLQHGVISPRYSMHSHSDLRCYSIQTVIPQFSFQNCLWRLKMTPRFFIGSERSPLLAVRNAVTVTLKNNTHNEIRIVTVRLIIVRLLLSEFSFRIYILFCWLPIIPVLTCTIMHSSQLPTISHVLICIHVGPITSLKRAPKNATMLNELDVNKEWGKMPDSEKSRATVICRPCNFILVQFDTQQFANMHKFTSTTLYCCNMVYPQHGGGNYWKQKAATVATWITTYE